MSRFPLPSTTETEFRTGRRQKFLTLAHYRLNVSLLDQLAEASEEGIAHRRRKGSLEPAGQASLFKDAIKRLTLDYTAGAAIEDLKPLYVQAGDAYARWHLAYREYLQAIEQESGSALDLDTSPLDLEDLGDYQLALTFVSLGVLLGETSTLQQALDLMSRLRGQDLLFESIVAPLTGDDHPTAEYFHVQPYDPLLDAFCTAESPEEASAFVERYLKGWYKGFEGLPWHDGHLKPTPEYVPYHGYWAFEAAAVCVIHGIDDAAFRDHLVYPKDVATWARKHLLAKGSGSLPSTTGEPSTGRLRCRGGDACPREGWWATPSGGGRRERFDQGAVMPSLAGDYGTTIWQWDDHQAP